MTQKILWLKGCAGLGNRLYTLSACIEYAKKTNRKLYIDWTDGQFADKGENAFFNVFDIKDLDVIYHISEINMNSSTTYFPKEWGENVDKSVYDLYKMIVNENRWLKKFPLHLIPRGSMRKINGYWRSINYWEKQKDKFSLIPFFMRKENILLADDYPYTYEEDILFCSDFCPTLRGKELIKHLVVKDSITSVIAQFIESNNLKGKLIGLHIRNTDKKPKEDTNKLISYLKQDKYNNKKILLCTDNPETEGYFKESLPNLITYDKEGYRDSVMAPHRISYSRDIDKGQMLRDSMIDMFLLSECDELLYQGNSSFSKISLALRKDQNKPAEDWFKIVS